MLEKPVMKRLGIHKYADNPITCINSTGFAHFLLEEVPRILWLRSHFPNITLLLPISANIHIINILEYLSKNKGFNFNIEKSDQQNVSVDNFVFTQEEAYSGFFSRNDLNILRDSFMSPCTRKISVQQKIYISRSKSPRSFDNEIDVEQVLRLNGFDVFYLEEMDFADQIELFNGANVIVAGHGAGLANLVWSYPGTSIIEIFSDKVFNDCFARICCQLNLNYIPVWAEKTEKWGKVDINNLLQHLNQII